METLKTSPKVWEDICDRLRSLENLYLEHSAKIHGI